jgi:hypothetical protein
MTRRYWRRVGGTLVEEFLMVPRRSNVGRRLADGLIILDGEDRRLTSAKATLDGKDVIVVQTKANHLGMYLLGQALFSRELISEFLTRGRFAPWHFARSTTLYCVPSPSIMALRSSSTTPCLGVRGTKNSSTTDCFYAVAGTGHGSQSPRNCWP